MSIQLQAKVSTLLMQSQGKSKNSKVEKYLLWEFLSVKGEGKSTLEQGEELF